LREQVALPILLKKSMLNARIDSTKHFDGHTVVLACFDLGEAEAAAAAHAVSALRADRYRHAELGIDEVLEMRELTALTDELGDVAARGAASTLVLAPARLTALRHALEAFVDGRDGAEWMREEDREPLAVARALLWPVADLCEEALRAALAAADAAPAG
jgi:hypothetical protein